MSRNAVTFYGLPRCVQVADRTFNLTWQDGIYYARICYIDSDKSHPVCNGDAAKCPDLWKLPKQPTEKRRAIWGHKPMVRQGADNAGPKALTDDNAPSNRIIGRKAVEQEVR